MRRTFIKARWTYLDEENCSVRMTLKNSAEKRVKAAFVSTHKPAKVHVAAPEGLGMWSGNWVQAAFIPPLHLTKVNVAAPEGLGIYGVSRRAYSAFNPILKPSKVHVAGPKGLRVRTAGKNCHYLHSCTDKRQSCSHIV